MTKVYIMRHSEPFRKLIGNKNSYEDDQLNNEKNILTVEGERIASEKASIPELQNIDVLYCSNYVRTQLTGKYIAENNNIPMNIEEGLGERKFGVDVKDLPEGYFKIQWNNYDFKAPNGESVNDTSKRMKETIDRILNDNKGKTISIVSHGTAMMAYFLNYCEVSTDGEAFTLSFQGNKVFDGFIGLVELFELEFDDNNNLISIKNIR